jgi:hypothetical protein
MSQFAFGCVVFLLAKQMSHERFVLPIKLCRTTISLTCACSRVMRQRRARSDSDARANPAVAMQLLRCGRTPGARPQIVVIQPRLLEGIPPKPSARPARRGLCRVDAEENAAQKNASTPQRIFQSASCSGACEMRVVCKSQYPPRPTYPSLAHISPP